MTDLFGKHKKALVIGAGSGRDMVSAVIITEKLRARGIQVDLAGFLTPWAVHYFNNRLEKPVNILAKDSKKFLAINLKKPLDSYFEPSLLNLNKKLDLGIKSFFLFSLHYGTSSLKDALQDIVIENNYDLIIAVDVGGDCLAMKEDFKSVFTPIVDFSCISILSKIRFNGDIFLSIIAPGSDGEIETARIKKIISILDKKRLIIKKEKISSSSRETRKFLQLNNQINKETSSTSGTFRTIEKCIGSGKYFKSENVYVKQLFVNGKKFELKFNHEIEKTLINSIIYLDLKKFSRFNKNSMDYDSILDAQNKYRRLYCGTEVDLSYIPVIKGSKITKVIYSLTSMNRIKGKLRKNIIQEGLKIANEKILPS